jgi:hypothetical protein
MKLATGFFLFVAVTTQRTRADIHVTDSHFFNTHEEAAQLVDLSASFLSEQGLRRTQSTCQAELTAIQTCGASQACTQCTDAIWQELGNLIFLGCSLVEDTMCNAVNVECASLCGDCGPQLLDFYECAISGCTNPWTCATPNPCLAEQTAYYGTCARDCVLCMFDEFDDFLALPDNSCSLFEQELCQGMYQDCTACSATCEPTVETYYECFAENNGCGNYGFVCPPGGTTSTTTTTTASTTPPPPPATTTASTTPPPTPTTAATTTIAAVTTTTVQATTKGTTDATTDGNTEDSTTPATTENNGDEGKDGDDDEEGEEDGEPSTNADRSNVGNGDDSNNTVLIAVIAVAGIAIVALAGVAVWMSKRSGGGKDDNSNNSTSHGDSNSSNPNAANMTAMGGSAVVGAPVYQRDAQGNLYPVQQPMPAPVVQGSVVTATPAPYVPNTFTNERDEGTYNVDV